MKQTAVEWLDSQLDFLHKCMSECDRINLFEQAKEMEKQHIGDAFMVGVKNEKYRFDTTEQCYNEIFKNK